MLNDLTAGAFNLGYTRTGPAATWTFQLMRPSWSVRCTNQPLFPTPAIDIDALPLIGTTYNLSLANGVPLSAAVLVSGLSTTGPAGLALPGAPGCSVYPTPVARAQAVIDAAGNASLPITIPNSTVLTGIVAYHQWAVLDAGANQLGIVMSEAGQATVGQ